MEKSKQNVYYSIIFILTSIGLLCIIMYSITAENIKFIFASISISILICLTSLMFGGLLGFLFGMPKVNNNYKIDNEKMQYLPNSNIEQISDWLTKVLIGVGLVESREIITGIWNIAGIIGYEITTIGFVPLRQCYIFGLTMYFLIEGFIIGYIATRILLPVIFSKK